MRWSRALPKEPGWYWRKNNAKDSPEFGEVEIVKVRYYDGRLSIGNYPLPKPKEYFTRYMWSGPIQEPIQ